MSGVRFSPCMSLPKNFSSSRKVIILLPAMLLTLLFTRKRWRTLLLDRLPSIPVIGMVLLLGCLLRPVGEQSHHRREERPIGYKPGREQRYRYCRNGSGGGDEGGVGVGRIVVGDGRTSVITYLVMMVP